MTLVFPFVPAQEIDDAVLADVAEVCAGFAPFELRFARSGRFPGVLYLEPEPEVPLRTLTAALASRFPQHPPYEGLFGDDPVPHLTVAQGEEALLDLAAREVEGGLPLTVVVREALLLEEVEPDWARWQPRARFAFGV